MKFKVGDKIRVKSFSELEKLFDENAIKDSDGDWYYKYKLSDGTKEEIYFTSGMKPTCEEAATVVSVNETFESYKFKFENTHINKNYQFIEDWLEPYTDKSIYVSSFDGEEENKSERLKTILAQIEQLAAEAHKIMEG